MRVFPAGRFPVVDRYAAAPVLTAIVLLNITGFFKDDIYTRLCSVMDEKSAVLLIGIIGGAVILLPACFVFAAGYGKVPTGIKPYGKKGFFFCIAVAASAFAVVLSQLQNIIFKSGQEQTAGSAELLFVNFIAFAVIPAICEEILLRKAVLSVLRQSFGAGVCVIFSSVYFAVLHGSWSASAVPLVMGIILSYSVLASGKIWPAVVIHLAVNSYSFYFEALLASTYFDDAKIIFTVFNLFLLLIFTYTCLKLFEQNAKALTPEKGGTGLKGALSKLWENRLSAACLFCIVMIFIFKNLIIRQ